jgi:hypothetical protein
MLVARSNKGETVVHGDLIGRKGETKVRLREGRHRSTKNSGKRLGHVIRHTNREKGSLVIIDGEARSLFEDLQDLLGLDNGFSRALTYIIDVIVIII